MFSAAPMNMSQPQQNIPNHLSSPLAAHFIETVNSRFDGDIAKALKHSETRNLAEAMGLVERKGFSVSSLNQSRIDAITHIFKDQSLDPASKLDAMKILLRSASGTCHCSNGRTFVLIVLHQTGSTPLNCHALC